MGAMLPNIDALIQAGINPATGLPYRLGEEKCMLKDNIRKSLRILDEQNAINRYTWYNLPNGLDGQLLERILYYKGQGMFFYLNEEFYFLPYALDGSIDVYGRFTSVTPVPFNGTSQENNGKSWITGLSRKVIYDANKEIELDDFENGCVLLWDYSKQRSETNIARQLIQEPILDAMAESFPMARTSLLANSGIKGMRVNDADQESNVKAASRSITRAALNGDPWIPFVGTVEFQDMTSAGSAIKSEEYLLYLQALDNYRLSLYGLKNGGLFQKKSHMLESEQEMNDGTSSLVYEDGLTLRQKFCDIVNAIWGLGISCEPSEAVLGVDMNGDGIATDEGPQEVEAASTESNQEGVEE